MCMKSVAQPPAPCSHNSPIKLHFISSDTTQRDLRALRHTPPTSLDEIVTFHHHCMTVRKMMNTNNANHQDDNKYRYLYKSKANALVSCRRSSIDVARELWGEMGAGDGGLSPKALVALSSLPRQYQQANQGFSWSTSAATKNMGDVKVIAANAHQGDIKTKIFPTCMVSNDDDDDEEVATRINIDSTKMSTESHLPSLTSTSNKAILRAKIDEMSWKLARTRARTGQSRILVQNHVPAKPSDSFPADHDQSCYPAKKKRRRDAELADAPEGLWRHFASEYVS